jgi:ketosteroid isomerase-like protein
VQLEIYAPPQFQWMIRQARGVDELRVAVRHNSESLSEQHPEIRTLCVDGDTIVVIGREHGRVKATGNRYRMEFVQRLLFRSGRLASISIIAAHDTGSEH